MQRLLDRVDWDVDAARDRLQAFVRETFGDPEGIGVLDETGFLKKGVASVGVQRQRWGTAGGRELPGSGLPDRRHAARARVPGPAPVPARGLV